MRISLTLLILLPIFCNCLSACTQTDKKQERIEISDTTTKHLDTETDTVSTEVTPIFTAVEFIKAKGIPIPNRIRDIIKETIDSVETIDFTGDKIDDYLVRTAGDKNSVGFEYWISSDYKIIKKTKYYLDAFHYRWFINLDHDPEPEIYDAVGEEDGADYTIQDQNLVTGKDSILLYINPVIIENGTKYWGYPWDISNIRARKNAHQVQLYCSLNHQIIRDGGWEIDPKHQTQMPVIFFDGHHTQDFEAKNVKNLQWLTLKEIVDKTKR